ncbi:MAG: glucan biosynthesis protein G [Burkholderiaceae bacterium]
MAVPVFRSAIGACRLASLACAALLLLACRTATAFGFEDVASRAQQLAAKAYSPPPKNLPRSLASLNYDQYRDIRFRPNRALWREEKLPFELAFFHEGLYFDHAVKINEVVGGQVRPIRFDPSMFDYGANKLDPDAMRELGFAGFRVHFPVNTPKYKDEVLVFLGASYFRAIGKGQLYGMSARGLAVDTALPSGEEFPQFTEFWIERPASNAKTLTIYALLDSRRVSGAYRFVVTPGVDTTMDVTARLFLREKVGKLGIAPLTSMYFFGENQRAPVEDYRPEVHDSDGLSVATGTGEWIWRPLVNPKKLLVTSYSLTDPAGFGLMQRDRAFASYQDLESHYESRPSTWVAPQGKWGAGRVELVQIPTPDETNDNVVAYWVPAKSPEPGQPADFAYRLSWQKDQETHPPTAWVTQTRRGHGGQHKPDGSVLLAVDFVGPSLQHLSDAIKPEAVVSADANGKIVETNTIRNDVTGGWRMTVQVRAVDPAKAVELRGYLRADNKPLSETWSYILSPDNAQ